MMRQLTLWRSIAMIFVITSLTACQAGGTPPPAAIQSPAPTNIIQPTTKPTTEPGPKAVTLDLQGFIQRVHDPVMSKENNKYYVFHTGSRIPFVCSNDMITWEFCGRIFDQNQPWFRDINPDLVDIWAPDISYFNNLWHIYCAISNFGSQNSAIGLVTNTTLDPKAPNYKWVDHGIVLQSKEGDPWNAIDPNLVQDNNGQTWLAWGSFWTGIYMHKIDSTSGKFATDDATFYHLADRSTGSDHPTSIEAPFIVKHDDKWYLFVSFDQCCNGVSSTYNVHVGRSDNLTGPYVDKEGVPLLKNGGTLLLSAYGQWKGPGHNGILIEDKTYWFVYHAYDAKQIGIPKMRIESITWDVDGWPTLPSQTTTP